jgi:hypothetical protein
MKSLVARAAYTLVLFFVLGAPTPALAQEDNIGTNPVNFTYDFRLIAEMAELDGGGSLLTTTAELRWPLGRNLANLTGEGPDSPFHDLGSLVGVRIRARYSNLSIPTPGAAPFGTSEVSGIGDFDIRMLGIAYASQRLIVATGLEAFFDTASNDAPFVVRWPGQIPAGGVSDDIVSEMDLSLTLARMTGGTVPDDRVIDGVDQTDFFTGRQENSNREGLIAYMGNDVWGVKWRNWKINFKEQETVFSETLTYGTPRVYNLLKDPGETQNVLFPETWVPKAALGQLAQHVGSLRANPPIAPGTPDPYEPPGGRR